MTVDRLRHQVCAILPNFTGQIEASIEHELQRAKTFSWEAEVAKAANAVLTEMVQQQVRNTIHADESIRRTISERASKIVAEELTRNVR
jgi:predicted KAP-like P-loop ATPase